jgi:hypothetical protein
MTKAAAAMMVMAAAETTLDPPLHDPYCFPSSLAKSSLKE